MIEWNNYSKCLVEKLVMFVVCKSKKKRWFSGVRHLPCWYQVQAKSWMSGELFEVWLFMLDNKFHQEERKVIMIIDNSPAHPHVGIDNLKATTIIYLSNNTISITQVMNQRVIQSLKAKYHKIPKYQFCLSHHSSFRL